MGTRFADGASQLVASGRKRRLDCLAKGSDCLLTVLHALLNIPESMAGRDSNKGGGVEDAYWPRDLGRAESLWRSRRAFVRVHATRHGATCTRYAIHRLSSPLHRLNGFQATLLTLSAMDAHRRSTEAPMDFQFTSRPSSGTTPVWAASPDESNTPRKRTFPCLLCMCVHTKQLLPRPFQ